MAKTKTIIVDRQVIKNDNLNQLLSSFGGPPGSTYRVTAVEVEEATGQVVSSAVALMVVPTNPELEG